MKYFPLYISLEDKKIIVIGGGNIAERRVATLLSFTRDITVIAPKLTEKLNAFWEKEKIQWISQRFEAESKEQKDRILSCDFVLGLTDERETNHKVFLLAKEAKIPVNIGDCKEECDFFFPAIIEGKDIVASITAGGNHHALVKRLAASMRRVLQEEERKDYET